jgi:hypothetical protein
MTDRKQFEAMLEALINGDQETAKEVFHSIVVAKSRDIYEELLESDFSKEEEEEEGMEEGAEEEEEEGSSEEEEGSDNPFGGEEEGAEDEEGEDEFGGEEDGEGEEDPFGGEEGGEEGLEDRVMDLEDALDELKAEFEELMAQEEEEGGHDIGAIDAAGDGMEGDDFGGEAEGGAGEEDELQAFMEYVDKVALPKHGDNGVNTKSIVAKKNDMGGTSANIVAGHVEVSADVGAKSTVKGNGVFKAGSPKLQDAGNVNVPGGNAGKTGFKKKEPGHGPEKKGAGETAANTKSIVGSRK